MAAVRFVMLVCLVLAGVCWVMYRWTGRVHWRRRSLGLLWGTLGGVMFGATALWLYSL